MEMIVDNDKKFMKMDRNLDVSDEEFKTLQELEKNDDGFKDEENSKYKKAGSPIAPLGGGGDATYFDYSDEYPAFEDVIAIQFQPAGKIYWYFYPEQKNPGKELKQGDIIVAYSERGLELAQVLNKSLDDFKKQNKINFIKNGFVRKAEPADFECEKQLEIKAKNAKNVIDRINKELGIKMKIVKVKYTLDDTKAIFYFSANGRVDFRELIKRLAFELKHRIEMRQIGVRDTTKIMGGLGPCGRALCCRKHMHNFLPVSIKMANDQNFSLNPNKISGICGRLFCCLGYENATYEELRKEYPKEESTIVDKNTNRRGIVKKINPIGKNITVFFPENAEKKEKAEEKMFSRSVLEFNDGWYINSPQNDSGETNFSDVTPVVAHEKELLLPDKERKNEKIRIDKKAENNGAETTKKQEKSNNPQFKKGYPREYKKGQNWNENRKNFRHHPIKDDSGDSDNKN